MRTNKNSPKEYNSFSEKKHFRIMSSAPTISHSLSYVHDYNILKFCDIVNNEACDFMNNYFNSNSFSVFGERFKLVSESYTHNTR